MMFFFSQLEMITDLLGTPSLEDVCHITSPSAVKNLLSQSKPAALAKLYQLAPNTSHGAVHLLSQMLIFNPVSQGRKCLDKLKGQLGGDQGHKTLQVVTLWSISFPFLIWQRFM